LLAAGPQGLQEDQGAEITGWVVSRKHERPEACNCHSKTRRDWHVLVAQRGDETPPARRVVTQITPRLPPRPADRGDQAKVRGWIFYDSRHANDLGRGTAWEIHPVTSIEVITGGGQPVGKLSASARAALPKSSFGQPGRRAYPMPDPSHAANAKARAAQQVK